MSCAEAGSGRLRALASQAAIQLSLVELASPVTTEEWAVLDVQERARAERFAFARDRQHYVAAHAALRHYLDQALRAAGAATDGSSPSATTGQLRFTTGPFGKPYLADPDRRLAFNLSHSGAWALLAQVPLPVPALATGPAAVPVEIGVDLEQIRALSDQPDLIKSICTPAEAAKLAELEEAERQVAFYACWTRKEACLKALGCGLQWDLREIEVDFGPDDRLVTVLPSPEVAIQVRSLALPLRDYAAALAWTVDARPIQA